jgi:hypothetical protein
MRSQRRCVECRQLTATLGWSRDALGCSVPAREEFGAIVAQVVARPYYGTWNVRPDELPILASAIMPTTANSPATPIRRKGILNRITDEQRRQIGSELVKTDLELVRAQAILETKQAAIEGENDL